MHAFSPPVDTALNLLLAPPPCSWCALVAFQQGGVIQDASDHARSLVAFEEMLDFLVVRLVSTASGVVPVKCVPRMEKRKMCLCMFSPVCVSDVLFFNQGRVMRERVDVVAKLPPRPASRTEIIDQVGTHDAKCLLSPV